MKAVIQLKSAYTPSPEGLAAKKRTSGKARLGTMNYSKKELKNGIISK